LSNSNASYLISLELEEQTKFLEELTPAEAAALMFHWEFWARPNQLAPPGAWQNWLLCAGRGFGKTRSGAEWIRSEAVSGGRRRLALVAPTAADGRDVMVEGESGILAISPPHERPLYEPSKRRLTWPNGALATVYSADEPERLRGPQHDGAWCDELASWRFVEDAWANLQFGLRLGEGPRSVITTTPKPIRIIRELLEAATTVVTRGSTYENRGNLADSFIDAVRSRYEGTRLGRQELYAEILEDAEGALWKRAELEEHRVRKAPELKRIVVACDPAATSGEEANETGIVVAGVSREGHGYILDDRTTRASPLKWAEAAVTAYHMFKADRLIAETNQGGEMVRSTIATVDAKVAYKGIHATRGKQTRAEPVAALYEQGKVHHVGAFADLEDQLCQWTPGSASPDRLDALVWALTELMLENEKPRTVVTF
jgi:phage terminase large subunit-like protein